MKKFSKYFQSYMIRPVIYQSVTKISIGLVLALLWNRYINKEALFSVVEDAFFVVGLCFFALAWIQYLRLDGLTFHYLMEEKHKKKKPVRHSYHDIADYADEKIISFAELEDDERIFCRMGANIVTALIFLIPAIVAMII